MNKTIRFSAISMLIFSLAITGCKKELTNSIDEEQFFTSLAATERKSNVMDGIVFYALEGNTLDKYSTTNAETLLGSVTITGLQISEKIVGLDYRPATGELYALGSNSRLYTINTTTGAATFVAALTNSVGGAPLTLEGSSFGFDFNPTVDRIRIVSNTGQNLRANPVNGVTIVDGSINPMPAAVNAVAYTNNDTDPGTGTTLYGFDVLSQQLYKVIPPNNGTLAEPLPVKLKVTGDGGFDIAPRSASVTTDIGLALYEVNNKSTLFSVDLATGDTRILAKYNKQTMYTSFAISPTQ